MPGAPPPPPPPPRGASLPSGNENPPKISRWRRDKSRWSVSETENWKSRSFQRKVDRNLVGSTWGHTRRPELLLSCITSKEITWSKGDQVRPWLEEVDFGWMRTGSSCDQLGCEFQPGKLVPWQANHWWGRRGEKGLLGATKVPQRPYTTACTNFLVQFGSANPHHVEIWRAGGSERRRVAA